MIASSADRGIGSTDPILGSTDPIAGSADPITQEIVARVSIRRGPIRRRSRSKA
jgi:hypothetical protein